MLDARHAERHTTQPSFNAGTPTIGQKVVIVNGSRSILDLLEAVFEAGHYDVVFVESNDRAYSQIRRVRPDLVILCVRNDDLEGFRVLSMLKLDEDTRSIPVLTYTMESDIEDAEAVSIEPLDIELLGHKRTEVMH